MMRLLAVGVMLLVAGCSSGERSWVSGTCSYGEVAIDEGQIRLFPVGETPGHGASTQIIKGAYAFEPAAGLVAGEYLVAVSATRATGRMLAGEGIPGEPETVPEIEQYIPERYNHASELRMTLKPGENHHDLALSK